MMSFKGNKNIMSETIFSQNSYSIVNHFFNLFFNIQLPKVMQPQFDSLYVFGDSLSDKGQFKRETQ